MPCSTELVAGHAEAGEGHGRGLVDHRRGGPAEGAQQLVRAALEHAVAAECVVVELDVGVLGLQALGEQRGVARLVARREAKRLGHAQ